MILQKSDKTLNKIRELANGNNEISRSSKFLLNEGLLYGDFHCGTGEVVHQIVVPEQFRENIIELAHDTLCGGHMGNRKTRNRILQNFYWPGIFIDVAKYCRSCPQCQISKAKGKPIRAYHLSLSLSLESQ